MLDAVVLGAFVVVKGQSDPWVIAIAAAGLLLIFGAERWWLQSQPGLDEQAEKKQSA